MSVFTYSTRAIYRESDYRIKFLSTFVQRGTYETKNFNSMHEKNKNPGY